MPLESQAAGTPIVAYAATGTIDALAHGVGGLLVPVGDVEKLGSSITALLEDAAMRRQMSADGAAWVRRHFDRHDVWSSLGYLYDDRGIRNPSVPHHPSHVGFRPAVRTMRVASGEG